MAEDRPDQEEESRGETGQTQMMLEQRSWRFAYEALTHVHSMRLFLFNPALSFPLRCHSLRAYLQPTSPFSASPVVVCRWNSPGGDSHTVYVPMPFCLIDHSAPFVVQCRTDFIEVKLKLLPFGGSFLDGLTFLGFSHRGIPIMRDGSRQTEAQKRDEAPFSLSSDAELLASKANVTFFCRKCSAKLTDGSLSRILELPSMEWRELADHWFGTCCCSDGAKTENLVAQFQQLMTPTRGLCLVGSTTCIIHSDDLVNGTQPHRKSSTIESSRGENVGVKEELSRSAVLSPEVVDETGKTTRGRSGHGLVVGCVPAALATDASEADTCGSVVTSQDAEDDVPVESKQSAEQKLVVTGGDHSMVETIEQRHACVTHCGGKHGVKREKLSTDPVATCKPMANGFMSGPSAASNSPNWTPVNCHSCSSLIGVTSGEEEGVQLFKCHVSTDESAGGPSDIFRYHTLDRVFCNELLANTEESSSYRYIIRGANTKMPLLQLVLLNHESWNCSGFCLGEVSSLSDDAQDPLKRKEACVFLDDEYDDNFMVSSPECELLVGLGKEEFPPAFLEPVMKVMFCDISDFSNEDLSGVEEWAEKHQADDIYMLESEISSLTKSLHENQRLFPDSCATFEQFRSSFLTR
ncbi:ubiquitin-protein ligase E3 D [Marchantia polymorpha subsp. ruderalis]|uniref:Ubiquitin-conjugating enzyme E2C-binding protein n=2 Tax=Marchantia polymorpha TaxID=3197 RepID=A0A176W8R7_MARPO|nr:hypothetical protein AXG93_3036s1390 [Marchantia polymorpha subsp. ruderalis]PTQ46399.1 hypothetical protein MARPO_0011s0081 [Marchantia polymorpha]BBN08363.1 hypothetical protein Mp_4g10960 [Marchantia polymorpha subsp. ruderalis]|eukprot:PTQ46399.1 hypothetical protein MARPO_0011s0081 [Marchantia polymorpha]